MQLASAARSPGPPPAPPAAAEVFRPLQYLGAKLRSLEALREVTAGRPVGRAVDVFTGSTVVAQALAAQGHVVEAYDALGMCASLARATLGVGRGEEDLQEVGRFLRQQAAHPDAEAFAPWLEAERRALAEGDGEALLRLGAEIPQVWRRAGATGRLATLLERVAAGSGQAATEVGPVAATHYAGTYLGITQALEADGLRRAIARSSGQLGPWATDAALAALVSALSAAAFTAGKHFAQPHRVDPRKDLAFHRRRALADRGRSIGADFQRALQALAALPTRGVHGHRAGRRTLESWLDHPRTDVDLIYADPPYTAQQYARFYHVPEVLLADRIPRLSVHRGRITAGLYPDGRHRSRFCSKRQAPSAFQDLIGLAATWRATLLLSYAASRTGRSGNDRMIGLDALVTACRSRFRDVQVLELTHGYRQLNHARAAVQGRGDVEVLICASEPC